MLVENVVQATIDIIQLIRHPYKHSDQVQVMSSNLVCHCSLALSDVKTGGNKQRKSIV